MYSKVEYLFSIFPPRVHPNRSPFEKHHIMISIRRVATCRTKSERVGDDLICLIARAHRDLSFSLQPCGPPLRDTRDLGWVFPQPKSRQAKSAQAKSVTWLGVTWLERPGLELTWLGATWLGVTWEACASPLRRTRSSHVSFRHASSVKTNKQPRKLCRLHVVLVV